MSATTRPSGLTPVLISILGEKVLLVIVPTVARLRNMDTIFLLVLVTMMSGLPSTSMSPIAMFEVCASSVGPLLVGRLAENAKELELMIPGVVVFLNTSTVLLVVV